MLDFSPPIATRVVLTVSELNRRVRDALESSLPLTWVTGEVSNLRRYDSGHCYFTLKDEEAQVDCVLFRHKLQHLDWVPDNGMQVEVRACPTLYEARGKFQLNVETMRRAGLGALYEAFERLKARLGAEGLFDADCKRALPPFPRRAGVVTSLQAAALRDVLTTLRRRMPGLPVIIYPTPVQGDGAAGRIAQTVTLAGARGECDVLIVCRGGGSIEDLWAYNEEAVARAIRACPIAVVTGVGHETDFTIADFVADLRAPTPTAAAELAVPDCIELRQQVQHQYDCLHRSLERLLEDRMQRLDYLSRRLLHPGDFIRNQVAHLHQLARRLRGGWQRQDQSRTWRALELTRRHARALPDIKHLVRYAADLARRLRKAARERLRASSSHLKAVEAHLKHLNPDRVLERGYSITETDAKRIVRDSATLALGAGLRIRFAKGSVTARVTDKADRKP